MIKKFNKDFGNVAIKTDSNIEAGTVLFKYEDWVEDERYGWETLSVSDILLLSKPQRDRFLKYSYDVDFGLTIGTFDWKNAKHISNYMNHSCDPNMMYNNIDCIIARKDLAAGEELTIDYGNFIVNFDQNFICNCGSYNCRKYIKKDDWKKLIPSYGFNFPTFMKNEISIKINNLRL